LKKIGRSDLLLAPPYAILETEAVAVQTIKRKKPGAFWATGFR
jgi:hypothetical protein